MRSITAVSLSFSGDHQNVFNEAVSELVEVLENLKDKQHNGLLARMALRFLNDKEKRTRLKSKFTLCCKVAKMTDLFLRVKDLKSKIDLDKNIYPDDDGFTNYALETGEFEGCVENPVAFVKAMLGRSIEEKTSTYSEKYRSAWLLFACASSLK